MLQVSVINPFTPNLAACKINAWVKRLLCVACLAGEWK